MKQTINFKIVRQNSQYNRYIKWFREFYNADGFMFSSIGYKTQREARDFDKQKTFEIGNKTIEYHYNEI